VTAPAWQLHLGDCAAPGGLAALATASVDALVTDPPAGIGFMGKEWDGDRGGRGAWVGWMTGIMRECLRVLKPGAHGFVWALPRTSHWTATALEDAGFEIRDVVTHHFGTGFPKSLDVSKAIDAAAGAQREVVGSRWGAKDSTAMLGRVNDDAWVPGGSTVTAPATPAAKQWAGWGTALKPATEHWILVRKPLDGTVAATVQRHGTGALNIDGCRIEAEAGRDAGSALRLAGDRPRDQYRTGTGAGPHDQTSLGRWPANLVLSHGPDCLDVGTREVQTGTAHEPDGERRRLVANAPGVSLGRTVGYGTGGKEVMAAWACAPGCPVAALDAQSGALQPGGALDGLEPSARAGNVYEGTFARGPWVPYDDAGAASRFFYCAKPARSERDAGCGSLPIATGGEATGRKDGSAGTQSPRAGAGRTGGARNTHPTVKPTELMEWLIRLITPPGATLLVLDPFAGSGTTGVAAVRLEHGFVGWEREPNYHEIATKRIEAAAAEPQQLGLFGGTP
jgi:hypothetical protein